MSFPANARRRFEHVMDGRFVVTVDGAIEPRRGQAGDAIAPGLLRRYFLSQPTITTTRELCRAQQPTDSAMISRSPATRMPSLTWYAVGDRHGVELERRAAA